MSYADDIRRIAKMPPENGGIDVKGERTVIDGSDQNMLSIEENESSTGVISPVKFEILTYDDALDEIIEANNGTFTVKTAETAKITDANGTVIYIDEFIYPAVP